MFTEIYIEALLVDEELADQVWEAWDAGEIDDQIAWLAWWLIIRRSIIGVKNKISHDDPTKQQSCSAQHR